MYGCEFAAQEIREVVAQYFCCGFFAAAGAGV